MRPWQMVIHSGGILLLLTACTPEQRWGRLQRHLVAQRQALFLVQKTHPSWLESLEIQQDSIRVARALQQLAQWKDQPVAEPQHWLRMVEQWQFAAKQLQDLRHNPLAYSIRPQLVKLLQKESTPGKKMMELQNWLAQAPAYYYRARRNLRAPTSHQCEAAVQEGIQTIALLEGGVKRWLQEHPYAITAPQQAWSAFDQAKLAVKDYLAWCRSVGLAPSEHPVLRQ